MKMFWKWALRSVIALLVLGAGADLYSKDRIERLRRSVESGTAIQLI